MNSLENPKGLGKAFFFPRSREHEAGCPPGAALPFRRPSSRPAGRREWAEAGGAASVLREKRGLPAVCATSWLRAGGSQRSLQREAGPRPTRPARRAAPRRRPRPQPGLARRAHGAAWRPPPALRPPESVRAGRRGWGCGGAGRSGAEGSGEERAGPGGFPRQRGRCPSARPAGLLLGAASGEALRSVGRGEACSDLTATSPEFSRR